MIATGSIHYARLDSSPRLQRLLAYLRQRGGAGATTREIIDGADICAVNSAVCELRRNGFQIDKDTMPSSTDARVYRYTLREAEPALPGAIFG